MSILRVKCSYCQKVFHREASRVHEARKFRWRQFCSLHCQSEYRSTVVETRCDFCGKKFRRPKKLLGKNKFCTQSCAASYNNSLVPKRKRVIHYCLWCNTLLLANRKYCSKDCLSASRKKDIEAVKHDVASSIVNFYKHYKRIPLKREMSRIYKNARLVFGSWNNAIVSLGYNPNPLLFANRVEAKDGHICDSVAERVIDDWLYDQNISHERNILYGKGKMTFDFKVGDTYIEYFGLNGNKKYDLLVKRKLRYWKLKKIQGIALYPRDLIPKDRLEERLMPVLENYRTASR